jgi:hypothetical protein
VAASFRETGARCLVVSGVVDPAPGVHVDRILRAALTVCRLRADRDELRRRLINRGGAVERVEDVLREADALDASDVTDTCVDTTGMAVTEVAQVVKKRTGGWPALTQSRSTRTARAPGQSATFACGQILWLCGATGVGKSTVGFEVYRRLCAPGSPPHTSISTASASWGCVGRAGYMSAFSPGAAYSGVGSE